MMALLLPAGGGDPVYPGSLIAQHGAGHCPALVLLADHVLLRHLHPVEEDLAVHPHDIGEEADRDTGALEVYQEEADAPLLLDVGVGPGQHEGPVGTVGGCAPYFLAVENEAVVLFHRLGGYGSQVRASPGFAESLAPHGLAAGNLGQVLFLLFLAAVLDQSGCQHKSALYVHSREFVVVHLVTENELPGN